MIEERDANPTADTPGRFRGRRAPTALTAGGTESSEVVARLSGTESSTSGESTANLVSAFPAPAEAALPGYGRLGPGPRGRGDLQMGTASV
jgi:hypothetical protein